MTRVAIAGLGHAGLGIHVPACGLLPDFEVVGGYDPGLNDTSKVDFPLFDSLSKLVAETAPDLMIVATPPHLHGPAVEEALEAGCHVLCEKPFTDTVFEARRLLKVAASSQRRIFVNNQYRYMPAHEAAKAASKTSEFGELLFVNAEQMFRRDLTAESGWRGQGSRRACREFGTHVFDLLRFFFDEEPLKLDARMPLRSAPDSPDFLVLVHLEFSRQRAAQVTLDRVTRGRHSYLDLRLDGSNATIETHMGGRAELRAGIRGGERRPFLDVEVAGGGTARLFNGESSRKLGASPLNLFVDATARLLGDVSSAIGSGGAVSCDGAQNIRTLALMEAAYEAAETRTTIEVSSLL